MSNGWDQNVKLPKPPPPVAVKGDGFWSEQPAQWSGAADRAAPTGLTEAKRLLGGSKK